MSRTISNVTPNLFKFSRSLLVSISCAALILGCDTPKPDAGTSSQFDAQPSNSSEPLAPIAPAPPPLGATQPLEPTAFSAGAGAAPGMEPTSARPLDLSRGYLTRPDQIHSAEATSSSDPKALLPNLFNHKAGKTRTRTSGRLLMREDEAVSMESIEGVEFRLEIPVN